MASKEMIDEEDRKIIAMLRENARRSLRSMAKEVKISPSSVRNRIERLVQKGIIKRFTVDVDPRKIGYELQVIVLVTSRPGASDSLFKALQSFPQISSVHWTSGPANFVCMIRVHDMNDLSHFLTSELEKLKGVERVESMFVMAQSEKDSLL